mgnify:CR=1 FL=1
MMASTSLRSNTSLIIFCSKDLVAIHFFCVLQPAAIQIAYYPANSTPGTFNAVARSPWPLDAEANYGKPYLIIRRDLF